MAADPIEHVIVLMLENRSFDHILAGTPKMRARYAADGMNRYAGRKYPQAPGAARTLAKDPVHETPDVLVQLGGKGGRVKMPNGILNLNLHWYDQATIFDRLNESNKSWCVYFGDTPLSLLFVHQWEPGNASRHHPMTDFFKDVAGDAQKFPQFAFIEPAYLQPGANDAHPPHDIVESDVLVASIYNAIRANDALWKSTLFVLLFDEHGGFYDHVSPPPAIPPDHHTEEYTFDRYGVRVPAILISPYAGNGIYSELCDHTSLSRYLQQKWSLGDMGARTAQANSLQPALQLDAPPRTDTPARITPTAASLASPVAAVDALSEHQTAIVAMSHNLEAMTDEDPNVVAARSRQILTGPQSQIDAAVDRVDRFLAQQKDVSAGR